MLGGSAAANLTLLRPRAAAARGKIYCRCGHLRTPTLQVVPRLSDKRQRRSINMGLCPVSCGDVNTWSRSTRLKLDQYLIAHELEPPVKRKEIEQASAAFSARLHCSRRLGSRTLKTRIPNGSVHLAMFGVFLN